MSDNSSPPVEEKVVLTDVTAATGNVVFEGLVRISGDVRDGALVNGSAGVQVMGSVLSGRVFSDGDITVHGSVLGQTGTVLRAGRRLFVRDVENASLVADSIVCQGSVRKSRIQAHSIFEASAGEGEVSFSQCRAGNRFIANVLGAVGDHETVIEIDLAEKARVMKSLMSVEEEARAAGLELEKLQRVVQMVRLMGDKVRTLSEDMQRDLRQKLQRVVELQGVMKDCESRREKLSVILEELVEGDASPPVEVRQKVIRGVTIRIDGTQLEVAESIPSGAAFYKRKRVVFRLL